MEKEKFNFAPDDEVTYFQNQDKEKVPQEVLKKHKILEKKVLQNERDSGKWLESKKMADETMKAFLEYVDDSESEVYEPYLQLSDTRAEFIFDETNNVSYIYIDPRYLKTVEVDRLASTINHERFHSISMNQVINHEGNDRYDAVSGLSLFNSDYGKWHLFPEDISLIQTKLKNWNGQEPFPSLGDQELDMYLQNKIETIGEAQDIRGVLFEQFEQLSDHQDVIVDDLSKNESFVNNALDEAVTDFLGTLTTQKFGSEELHYDHWKNVLQSIYYENSVKFLELYEILDDEHQERLIKCLYYAKKESDPSLILSFFESVLPQSKKISTEELFSLDFEKYFEEIEGYMEGRIYKNEEVRKKALSI